MGPFEQALLHLAQWLALGAILIATGAGIFSIVVWRGPALVPRPAPVEIAFGRRWRRLVGGSVVVAILASVPLLIRGEDPAIEAIRLGLVLIGGLLWLVAGRTGWLMQDRSAGPFPWVLGVAALLALLLGATFSGHARGSTLPLPNFLVALLHVTAAAAWVGGLVVLVAVAFPSVRGSADADRASLLAPVVARFSDLAVWSVLAVVASGTYSAWMEIRGLRALTASTYGLVFMAKLAAFGPVLALGAVNNRWTKPRLVRAVRQQLPASSSLRMLRRMVALEIVLIAVVLTMTVFLLQLSPPAISQAAP